MNKIKRKEIHCIDRYIDKLIKDETVTVRLPKILKEEMEKERKILGYVSLSTYVLGILMNRLK